jgi:phospholipid N-methyltransferase
MIPHFYVFGSGMKHWVFGYAYGTGAITKKWVWVHSSPKSLKVYEIHNSWEQQLAAATYSASVVD